MRYDCLILSFTLISVDDDMLSEELYMLVDRLIPLKIFAAKYPQLGTPGTIRRWIRRNHKGFGACAVKISEQNYSIDMDAFDQWLESQRVNQHLEK